MKSQFPGGICPFCQRITNLVTGETANAAFNVGPTHYQLPAAVNTNFTKQKSFLSVNLIFFSTLVLNATNRANQNSKINHRKKVGIAD